MDKRKRNFLMVIISSYYGKVLLKNELDLIVFSSICYISRYTFRLLGNHHAGSLTPNAYPDGMSVIGLIFMAPNTMHFHIKADLHHALREAGG